MNATLVPFCSTTHLCSFDALGIKEESCQVIICHVVFYHVICDIFLILQHTPVGQMVFAIWPNIHDLIMELVKLFTL
jgi:hypothetical protein